MAWPNVFTASRMDRSQGTQPGACCNGAGRDPMMRAMAAVGGIRRGEDLRAVSEGKSTGLGGLDVRRVKRMGHYPETGAGAGVGAGEGGRIQPLLGHGEVTSFPHKYAVAELSVRPRTSPLQVNGEKEGFRAFFSLRLQPASTPRGRFQLLSVPASPSPTHTTPALNHTSPCVHSPARGNGGQLAGPLVPHSRPVKPHFCFLPCFLWLCAYHKAISRCIHTAGCVAWDYSTRR